MANARPYRWLAEYYDRIFTVHLPGARAARGEILGSLLPVVRSACDLACGTGTTAVELAGRGIEVYGVDLSPAMCRLARAKARRAGVRLRVIRGDMRTFRLPAPVDLVVCEFDALNHVPHRGDLAGVLGSVARALRPGGHFYFDVNNRASFERMWPLTWFVEKPGVVAVMHGGADPENGRAWTDVEWFLRDGRRWIRRRERVEEVCWTPAEMRAALRDAGFDRVRARDAAPFFAREASIARGHRTIYLARKR